MTTARLASDSILLATDETDTVYVLLIRRKWQPFIGLWAFPGGHIDDDEDTKDAAYRELAEETGIDLAALDTPLSEVGVYAAPGRDPRGRYVAFAYAAALAAMPTPHRGG